MTEREHSTVVGQLPRTDVSSPLTPAMLTRLVWALWMASLGLLAVGATWTGPGVAVDGLTVLMWVVVTFFSGIVHSYSRRYMAGSDHLGRFFYRLFAFTLVVMTLVAADHVALFALAWLGMGLVMADLIGIVRGWPQARAAGALARRYFVASGALLGAVLALLAWATGETTISGIGAQADALSIPVWAVAVGGLILVAMAQSALLPFHAWLLSSMTAPTPASALMHAGFVNAGGILLLRFAPLVTLDAMAMQILVVVGAISALGGKLLKTVQTDIKRQLGCSTVGQMGFMIMQAGLGFFGAAITHLILHGFFKAYQFLSVGDEIERTQPTTDHESSSMGVAGAVTTGLTALAGGAVFVALTDKGTHFGSGLVLVALVVLTTLHAVRSVVGAASVPAAVRFVAVPLVAVTAIAGYGLAYRAVDVALADLPVVTAPADLTIVHGLVLAAFLAAYLAIERGVYERSEWLYVTLLNATQPDPETLLTSQEEYNEY
ncbi:proton-conducting transporter transmembrane domain-containing protein [Haloplanus sp. C73]|uniref:proton-conducting transporter transmembrane domain-containing protein n=1 Tax=Haloplanus sp. C73 TaxID=3421641 RepID=UPI003EBE3F80